MAINDLSSACIVCGTVLRGPLGSLVNLFGITRSPQNPNICNRCSTHIQEGSITELTIFFADLVGFTAMTNELGAQKSFEIVNTIFKKAGEILVRHDALVDKFIGDAVMAIFNTPIRREDHVLQAVRAGIEFQEELQPFRDQFGRDLQFRIGIAKGYAHVGHLGSQERKDYTAIGEVVNLASRLESIARPGEIVLNDAAFENIKQHYPAVQSESVRLKGFHNEVPIFRIKSSGTRIEVKEEAKPRFFSRSKNRLSVGSILFALLGAPCVGVAMLGPLSVALGIGTLMGSLSAMFAFLDQPFVQIPLHTVAGIGAIANLAVIWYGYQRRKRNILMRTVLTRHERIKVTLVLLVSVIALLLILFELYIHLILGHHLVI